MKITDLFESADVSYHMRSPSEISSEDMSAIAQLIASGQEVSMSVVNRNLANAAKIAYATDKGKPIGVIVFKDPVQSYKEKVFDAAGVPELTDNYNLEIGYAYVMPEYRTQWVGINLCRNVLGEMNMPIFATTREANTTINTILKFARFKQTGEPYMSDRGDYKLLLWTKG